MNDLCGLCNDKVAARKSASLRQLVTAVNVVALPEGDYGSAATCDTCATHLWISPARAAAGAVPDNSSMPGGNEAEAASAGEAPAASNNCSMSGRVGAPAASAASTATAASSGGAAIAVAATAADGAASVFRNTRALSSNMLSAFAYDSSSDDGDCDLGQ